MSPVTDPLQMAILTNRMQAIVQQMLNTMYRVGRSAIINTARDVVASIVTADDELLALGESLPIMTMAGPDLVTRYAREVHPVVCAGDAFLHNDPYNGNSHAADHGVLAPIVDAEGQLRFWAYVKAHVADTGNSIPTTAMPSARDVYEEGTLIFPCVKVQSRYEDIDDVLRMCRSRIRVSDMWMGDFRAMLGAVRTAERDVLALGAEVGWDVLTAYSLDWLDYGEQRMRKAISQLPAGTRTGTTRYDAQPFAGVEDGLTIQATVDVRPDEGRIVVDCRDNPDCVPCGVNLTEATSLAAVRFAVYNSLPDDIPVNSGAFRAIEVLSREGSVCGIPTHPHSCSMATTSIANRLSGAVQLAFAELGDGIGMAEAGGSYAAADSVISGFDPRYGGARFVNLPVVGITGGPATAQSDGWIQYVGGAGGMMLRDSTEMDELLHPILIEEDRLVPDSEGAGRFRGALANYVEYGPVGTEIDLVCSAEATVSPARGARGGGDGQVAHQYKRLADGTLETVVSPSVVHLGQGERIVSYCSSGGGYGPPWERAIERVLHDLTEGYLTRQHAYEVYGVALANDGAADELATATQRAKLAASAKAS